MRAGSPTIVAIGSALLLFGASVGAHHSFAAEFDAAKPVSLTGEVTKVEWTNPHVHLDLKVTEAGGLATAWRFELATPNVLMRGGWLSTAVRPGDKITVNGFAAKDGSHFAYARAVISSDGRTLFARSSFETVPTK